MKTKNIFRMLLVAAALLMGANNVKADTELWSGTTPKTVGWYDSDPVMFSKSFFENASPQDIVRINGSGTNEWQLKIAVGNLYGNRSDVTGSLKQTDGTAINNGHVDIELTQDMIDQISDDEFGNVFIAGCNFTVTSVVLVTSSGNGTETPTTYRITIANNIQNGSVSANKTSNIAAGETITLTPTPNTGYELSAWDVKDASNNAITVTNNQFSMPASNVTVSATFTPSYSVPEGAERNNLTFKTEEYCAATWDSDTNTFTWGNRDGWNTAWTFMAAVGISGDLSNWTHLHLQVSNWTNASAKQLRVVFKEADGNVPSNGDIKDFVVSPNASGNIDLNLVGVNWDDCDITNIYDLTIYGCARDDESQAASVLVTDAYYVTATVSETYTVSVSAGSNGSAYVDKQNAASGEKVTIYTNPNSGYRVSSVTVAGVSVSEETANTTYSFTMPANNVTVNVTFELETQGTPDQVVIGSTGYATYSNADNAINLSGLSGVKAYIATAISLEQNKVTLTQVSGVVAANTGLIFISENKQPGTFNLPIASSTGTTYNNNLLLPSYANTTLSPSDAWYTYYVLVQRENNSVKFAEVYSYDAQPGAGKAYLRTSKNQASARTRGLSIEINDGTTGINAVENEQGENVIYNLRGQRVENPTKGLYIINGKKVLIK
jgi:hypothetical protein